MLVTQSAVISRINRKLAHEGEALKKSRSMRMYLEVGDFYILNINGNYIVRHHMDVEDLARELGVLYPFEEIADTRPTIPAE